MTSQMPYTGPGEIVWRGGRVKARNLSTIDHSMAHISASQSCRQRPGVSCYPGSGTKGDVELTLVDFVQERKQFSDE
jgi:hypothetical protein